MLNTLKKHLKKSEDDHSADLNDQGFVFEALEPRVLLSADLAGVAAQLAIVEEQTQATAAEELVIQQHEEPVAVTTLDTPVETQSDSLLRHEIAFVDTAVEDYQSLVNDLLANQSDDKYIEVVLLDSNRNGIDQITEVLAEYQNIDAIHIVSHGTENAVKLGNTWLDLNNLDDYSDDISSWGTSFTEDADIQFYGCNLAAGDDGRSLINQISKLTDADVSASIDDTGSAALGGDWVLEFSTGNIETEVAFSAQAQDSFLGLLNTFTVTNTNDSGAGSLRQAIIDANALAGIDTIDFNISTTDSRYFFYEDDGIANSLTGVITHTPTLADVDFNKGWYSIQLGALLPAITDTVIIDGTTQSGFIDSPIIEIDGANSVTDGISINSNNSTIQGLVINRMNDDGIDLDSGFSGNTIIGNYIGTDVSGTVTTGFGNGDAGIDLNGNNNTIGGSGTSDRNIISGNTNAGILIDGVAASGNIISGNYIGVDAPGNTALGTGFQGIYILNSANNTTIENNIIGGASQRGIEITGSVSGTVIKGNNIGTDATGTLDFGNTLEGIYLRNGASNSLIGGTTTTEANQIANNSHGIRLKSDAGTGNAILGNAIYANTGLGLDLRGGTETNEVTANDAGDADSGGNSLQNFPVLTSSITSGGDTTIVGTFNSSSTTNYRIEFFSSAAGDGTGYGEAETYLGFVNVTTDGGGNATINTVLTGIVVSSGHQVTATATVDLGGGNYGDTSEFAQNVTAVQINNDAPTDLTPNSLSVDEGVSDGTVVGTIIGADPERDALIASLLATDPDLTYDVGTGKFYKVVTADITWQTAKTNAESTSLNSINGQLVVIRSAAENDIVQQIGETTNDDSVWIGATDQTTEGQWHWIENGLETDLFFQGGNSGSPVNNSYTNWESGQPNNNGGNEDAARLKVSTGNWLDSGVSGRTESYVVEWNADTVLDVSEALTYSITSQTVTGAFAVDADSGLLTVADGSLLDYETNSTHSLTVRVTDSASNTYDEVLAIAIANVNEAPSGADKTVTAIEDTDYVFTVADFGFTDVESPADNFLNVIIASAPANGILYLDANGDGIVDGETLMATNVVSVADITAGKLKFQPAADANGTGYDSFTFQMQDDGGVANSGVDTDQSANTITIDVTAVNDAPTITKEAIFTDSNQSLGSSNSTEIDMGDIDGDGDIDMVVANYSGQANKVFLNDGLGNYTDSGQSLGNSNSLTIALGDIDGDGDLDMVVGNYTGHTSRVYTNDGTGNFTDDGIGLGHGNTTSVELGDVDGDGDLDIVLGNLGAGNKVFTNNGTGMFTDSGQSIGSANTRSITLGDIDNDGDLDLISGDQSLPNKIYLNDGSGDFTASVPTNAGTSTSTYAVTLGDIDGDGDLDLIEGNYGSANKILTNDGNGSFVDTGQSLGNANSTSLTMGDLDSDGDLDLVFGNSGGPNSVFINNGSGNYSSGQNIGNADSTAIHLADVNADGDLDIIVGNTSGVANQVFFNDSTISSLPTLTLTEGDPAQTITNTGIISDVDSVDFDTGNITINYSVTGDAGDQLSINHQGTGSGQIGFDGSNVSYEGTNIGTLNVTNDGVNGNSFSIDLNNNATQIALTALLNNITFQNTSDTPAASRTLSITVNDGNGGTSTSISQVISVAAVNDAPIFTFSDGIVTSTLRNPAEMAVQADGKILATGSVWINTNLGVALARYNADGSLDTSFGTNGVVETEVSANLNQGFNVAVQSDGKIVVVGRNDNGTDDDVVLIRYESDGSLDLGFGTNGIVTTDLGGEEIAYGVEFVNGGILVSGTSDNNFMLLRYLSNGVLDTSFGTSGSVIHDLGGTDIARTVLVQSTGKIVIAGQSSGEFAVMRFDSTGSLDMSFGTSGITKTTPDGYAQALSASLQSDDKIVVTGNAKLNGVPQIALVRYTADGTLDASFDTDGIVTTDLTSGSDYANRITIQSNGKIVAAGHSDVSGDYSYSLTRYHPDGSVDTSFGDNGKVILSQGATPIGASGVFVNPDGSIAFLATHNYKLGLMLFDSSGNLDTGFGVPVTFIENGSAVRLNDSAQIFDAELTSIDDFGGTTLTLARTGGANAEDQFNTSGNVIASGSPSYEVRVSGVLVGTYIHAGGELAITFNNNASQALVNETLQSITYSNSSTNPPASVQIDWTLNDSNTGLQGVGGALEVTSRTFVNITPVNAAPTVTTTVANLNYNENDPAAVIDAGLLLSDVDSATLSQAIVRITNNFSVNDDVLAFVDQLGITGAYNTDTGVLTLSGVSTIANYQTALRSVTYQNTTSTLQREITFMVNDGVDSSAPATRLIDVTAVNDAPTITKEAIFTDNNQSLGSSSSRGIDMGDVDGDGDIDMVVANYSGQANNVFLNDGLGNYADSGQNLGNSNSISIALGDIDGDGDLDMVVGNFTGFISRVYINDGTGNFTDDGMGLGSGNTSSVELGDVDGDGDLDIVLGNTGEGNKVFINNGAGSFTDSGQSLGSENTLSMALGDIDSDGDLDLISGDYSQSNKIYLNDGSGDFTVSTPTSIGTSTNTYAITLGDIDGDGDLDLIEANVNSANKIFTNDGSGNFVDTGQTLGVAASRSLAAGDIDNDGDLDLVFANSGGSDSVFINDGTGNYSSGQSIGNADSSAIHLADVNADGDLDIIVGNDTGVADQVFFNDSTISSLSTLTLNEGDPAQTLTSVGIIGDIDSIDFDGGTLSLSYSVAGDAADQLSVNDQGTGVGQIGFDGSNVSYENTNIGTLNIVNDGVNGNALIIDLNANATPSALTALLNNIAFQNTSDNPAASRTLSITVNDGDDGTSTSISQVINITALNDLPSSTNATILASTNSTFVFNATHFNFSDLDTGDSLQQIRISGIAGNGSLQNNGSTVLENQVITRADIDSGLLTFTPVVSTSGSNYASFNFEVHDGTAYAGSTSAATINVGGLTPFFNQRIQGGGIVVDSAGMRSNGAFTGGTLTPTFFVGIPDFATVVNAYLLINELDYGSLDTTFTLGGNAVTVSQVGESADPNWGSSRVVTLRADVTSIVTGNGGYTLGGADGIGADAYEGAVLVVVYEDLTVAADSIVTLHEGSISQLDSPVSIPMEFNAGNPLPQNFIGANMTLVGFDGQDGFPESGLDFQSTTAGSATTIIPANSFDSNQGGSEKFIIDISPYITQADTGAELTQTTTPINTDDYIVYPFLGTVIQLDNAAPTLDNTGNMALTTITEDQTNSAGNIISDIILSAGGDRIDDLDLGALEGIAITSLSSGNGSWEYSTNTGVSWNAVGVVSDASALLLRNSDYLRFIPDGQNADMASIDFRAWDQTNSTAGNKVDTSTNGGSTAFSTATETATIMATSVNDQLTTNLSINQTKAYNEGDPSVALDNIIVTDVDSAEMITATLTLNDPTFGSLSTSSSASYVGVSGVWSITDTVTAVNAALANVVFNPTLNNDQNTIVSVSIADGGENGTTAATGTITLNVTAINDPPIVTNSAGTISYTEQNPAVVIDSGLTIADPDGKNGLINAPDFSAVVRIATNFDGNDLLGFTNTANIQGNLVGDTLTLSVVAAQTATVADFEAALQSITFFNGSDDPGILDRTINFSFDDGLVNSNIDTKIIQFTAVNDPPTLATNTGTTVTEGSTGTIITTAMLNEGDPDDSGIAAGLTYTITTIPTNGTLRLLGTALINGNTFTQNDIDNNRVTYDHDGSETISDSFIFDLADGGEDGALPLTGQTFSITVTPANDAPVVTPTVAPVTYQGNNINIDIGIVISDADSAQLIGATISITSGFLPTEDILGFTNKLGITGSYNSTTGVLTLTGTTTAANYQSAIQSVFYDNGEADPNSTTRTISFVVDDGTDTNVTATRDLNINVNQSPLIDAPLLQTTPLNTALIFSAGNANLISISDPDVGNVEITLTVTNGTLSLNGITNLVFTIGSGSADATMTFSGSVLDINNALNGMFYSPLAAYNGASTLQILVDDLANGGGTARVDSTSTFITVGGTVPLATDDPKDFNSEISAINPIGNWHLGDGGLTATDDGSAGIDGTLVGGVLTGQPGALNGDANTAVQFDGINDYIAIPHATDFELDNGTVQFWFKADSIGGLQGLFSKDHFDFGNGGHVGIWLDNAGNIQSCIQSDSADYTVTSSTTINVGQWHHVALSFGSNGMELYVDGVISDVNGYTGGLATTSGGTGNSEPIVLGAMTFRSNPGVLDNVENFFQGSIDEVSLVGSQLNAEQIQNLYASRSQNYTIVENTVLNVAANEGVLINDSDADGDPLTAVLVSGPSNATAFTLNADGSFDYTPIAGFDGTDTFTYGANDGTNNSNIATVTITVTGSNNPPTLATNTGTAVNEGSSGTTITTAMLNEGDVDDSGTGLAYTVTTIPANGTLRLSGTALINGNSFTQDDIDNNRITYDHVGSETTTDSFIFDLADGGEDGALPLTGQTFSITVTPANDNNPAITSPNTANVEENTTAVQTVTVTDADLPGDSFTYSIAGSGADDALFTIDGSGNLSFIAAPDFEVPTDANLDGDYVVDVSVFDGVNTSVQTITVTVTAVNDNNPVITSPNTANVAENTTAVQTVTVTDADLPGDTFTYSIAGSGADDALFAIDGSGNLSFIATPNFEVPTDANLDGDYVVDVSVFDGVNTSVQTITVTVTDANETPTTSGISNVTINEDAVDSVINLFAAFADVEDADSALTYTITGNTNPGLFTSTAINGVAGTLTLDYAPDQNGVASITVRATDTGALFVETTFTVTVNAINDPPTLATNTGTTVNEGSSGTIITTAMLNEGDLDDSGIGLTYTVTTIPANGTLRLSGAALINGNTFTQDDIDNNRITYDHDGTETVSDSFIFDLADGSEDGATPLTGQTFNFTVTPVNDNNPVITSPNTANVAENTTAVQTVMVTDADLPGDSFTYSIAGSGADDALFTIDGSGNLSFIAAPDFEVPTDANLDGDYVVDVQVFDGVNTVTQTITVTVTAINDNAPIFSNPSLAFVVENSTGTVQTVTVSDADLPGDTFTYSIAGSGADDALFTIDGSGNLSFIAAPDFETPSDANMDNDYIVDVQVFDGVNTTVQTNTIRVLAMNDNIPVFTSPTTASIPENTTAVHTVTITDADLPGDTITYSIAGTGADDSHFNIDGSGNLSFTVAPDFEVPGDADFNNDYIVDVQVFDGVNTVTQTITISVLNGNEMPTTSGLTDTTVNEDTVSSVKSLFVAFDDIEDLDPALTYTISNNTNPGLFSATIINGVAGSLTLNYAPDQSGTADITVRATDTGGLLVETTFTVTVNPVNDAPTANNDSASVNEGGNIVVNLIANDSDIDNNLDLNSLTIISGPTNGSLVSNGDGTVTYTHNDSETLTDSFSYTIKDNAGATSNIATVNLTVTPANDAPSLTTPPDQVININTDLVFSNVNGNPVLIGDIDAGSSPLQVTLTVTDGVLHLANTTKLSFTDGDGVADITLTFTGTLTDINTALDGLIFHADDGFTGATNLQIIVNDLGSGTGNSQLSTSSIAIEINSGFILEPPPVDPIPDPEVPDPVTPEEPINNPEDPEDEKQPSDPAPDEEETLKINPITDQPGDLVSDEITTDLDPVIENTDPYFEVELEQVEDLVDVTLEKNQQAQTKITTAPISAKAQLLQAAKVRQQKIAVPEKQAYTIDPGLLHELDRLDKEISEEAHQQSKEELIIKRTAEVGTVVLFAGFVKWILQASSLFASVLGTLPAWRWVDPIPVLTKSREEKEKNQVKKRKDLTTTFKAMLNKTRLNKLRSNKSSKTKVINKP